MSPYAAVGASLAAGVAGYALGRLRPAQRLCGRLYGFATAPHRRRTPGRYAAEAASAAMLLGALIARPVRTVRAIHANQHTADRLPVLEMDPKWSGGQQ